MPEWIRKRYFYSINSMKRTLAKCYSISFLILLVQYLGHKEYIRHGRYSVRGYAYEGNEVLIPLYGGLFLSFLMIGFTVYSTFYGIYQVKKGNIAHIPKNSICYKCESIFDESQITMVCPKCSIKLEDLIGFYERHPEKKIETV